MPVLLEPTEISLPEQSAPPPALSLREKGRGKGEISPWLYRFARMTAGAAFLLLIAGGLVTSTRSGLAVPDWPLSYGRFFPPMRGGILFEHGHRMIAGTVGLMIFTLTVWIWKGQLERMVRTLAALAAIAVVGQAALGGLTVLLRLPASVSIAHAVLGQTVFLLLVCLSELLGRHPGESRGPVFNRTWIPAFAGMTEQKSEKNTGGKPNLNEFFRLNLIVALYLQLILGAIVRHTGHALAFHTLGALAVLVAIGSAVSAISFSGARFVYTLPALAFLQIFLGVGTLWVRMSALPSLEIFTVFLSTAHLACGALLLAEAGIFTLRSVIFGLENGIS